MEKMENVYEDLKKGARDRIYTVIKKSNSNVWKAKVSKQTNLPYEELSRTSVESYLSTKKPSLANSASNITL